MKKHLTFKDEKSDKFWSIETFATSYTVFFGKAGTEGQSSYRSFDTAEKCSKEAEKLVKEKLKKGYMEKKAIVKPVSRDFTLQLVSCYYHCSRHCDAF